MTQEKRSNKWAFLIYEESAPKNYIEILENIHIPYILSPWHNQDIDKKTGEFKKSHKHGALFFESLKSASQVSELLQPLSGPEYVEIIHSAKGMYDYFIHAENLDKTPYDLKDIESGCGFELDKFLAENNPDLIQEIYEILKDSGLMEFADFTDFVAENYPDLLFEVYDKSYFFKIYLDSKRYIAEKNRI